MSRSFNVNRGGLPNSENAGLSNENICENQILRKSKVSVGRLVRDGLVKI